MEQMRERDMRLLKDGTNEELLALYQTTGKLEIKQELALRYLYIVKSIAVQMRDVYVSFTQMEDIVNEGVLVLMGAIDKYDEAKNAKFETYVSKRIRGMVIDIARKQDWVPRTVRKTLRDINETTTQLYSELERTPTFGEVANKLDMEEGRLLEIAGKANLASVLSLDMILEETSEKRKTTQIPSNKSDEQPEESYLENEFKEMLASGIQSLKENEQTVISLYYVEELNMKEIAAIIQVSEPRISQIHANAIQKLRDYIEANNNNQ